MEVGKNPSSSKGATRYKKKEWKSLFDPLKTSQIFTISRQSKQKVCKSYVQKYGESLK